MRTAIASAQAGALPVGGATGRWAVADKPELFASMSAEQVVANFGGRARLRQLQARTQRAALAQLGVEGLDQLLHLLLAWVISTPQLHPPLLRLPRVSSGHGAGYAQAQNNSSSGLCS